MRLVVVTLSDVTTLEELRPLIAESSGRTTISSLSYGKISCYVQVVLYKNCINFHGKSVVKKVF